MIKADIHLHTKFSTDGKSEMADMISAAEAKGLETICFTEHMDYGSTYPDGVFTVDTPAYYKRYQELTGELKEKGSPLEVLFGVELGLQPVAEIEAFNRDYAGKFPFSFIIGSSHILNGFDAAFSEFFEHYSSEKEAMRAYFEAELTCADRMSDIFDIYGHLDYAIRYLPSGDTSFSYREYGDVLDEILHTLIEKGKGIELNTGGFRKMIRRINPHPTIVKRYKEFGGEIITIGSDAHLTEDIAANFGDAEKLLHECGFKYYTVFRDRKPCFIEL